MAYTPSKKPRSAPTMNGKTPLQICQEMDYDPFVEQVKLCKARVTVRDIHGTPLRDENGKIETRPLLEPRLLVEANKSLMEMCYAKLRTQEVKEQLDVKFTVTINRFEEPKKLPEPRPAIDIGMVE